MKNRSIHFLLLAFFMVPWAAVFASVGEVSLVIGVAQRISNDGMVVPVERNMALQAGDSIETTAGGHVHIRFVDGGLISVRPESRLTIESYQPDVAGKSNASIKFRLDKGVVRSVTGAWGEANRDRFRLNTPIAAIGVKGTDFVVQANAEQIRAAVVSGAIVVAPFGEGCRQDWLGPCSTSGAATLAADMGKLMLEMSRQEAIPRIVPLGQLQISAMSQHPPLIQPNSAGQEHSSAGEPMKPLVETNVNQVVQLSPEVIVPPEADSSPLPSFLVWGRWLPRREGDNTTVSQDEARQDGARKFAIASPDGYYMLYRSDGYKANFPASLGSVQFAFRGGQAFLSQTDHFYPVSILGGALGVNFTNGTFATTLNMSHEKLGAVQMVANGAVDSNGVLRYRPGGGQYVAGALSTDVGQAAYAFGQPTPLGLISGIAHWGRK